MPSKKVRLQPAQLKRVVTTRFVKTPYGTGVATRGSKLKKQEPLELTQKKLAKKKMMKIKTLIAAAILASALSVQAIPVEHLGFVSKGGTGIGGGNSNNAENNFFRLERFLGEDLDCEPLWDGRARYEGRGVWNDFENGGLSGFAYAVVHYGNGGGYGQGGGGTISFFALNGNDAYTFLQQGFSSLDLFRGDCESVPDAGTTLVLLGGSLIGLGALRRRFSK